MPSKLDEPSTLRIGIQKTDRDHLEMERVVVKVQIVLVFRIRKGPTNKAHDREGGTQQQRGGRRAPLALGIQETKEARWKG